MTFCFQTELWISTHPTVSGTRQDAAANKHTAVSDDHRDISNTELIISDVRHDVSDTHPVVSDVLSDITNIRTVVSGTHRTKLKSREGADDQNRAVSTTRTLTVTE